MSWCDYRKQEIYPLSFFRIRPPKHDNESRKIKEGGRNELLHPPRLFTKSNTPERFGLNGIPCLYLATTSYCCWNELGNPNSFYISAFHPNDMGKMYKILNLVLDTHIINGFDCNPYSPMPATVQKMFVLFPLVMATSVINPSKQADNIHRNEDDRNIVSHPEYIISQLIMECLKELHIDGVAYLSTRTSDPYRFPHSINLVLPAYKDSEGAEYGEICEGFDMTDTSLIDSLKCVPEVKVTDSQSYINAIYSEVGVHSTIQEERNCDDSDKHPRRVAYNTTPFSKLDDFMVNKKFYPAPEKH